MPAHRTDQHQRLAHVGAVAPNAGGDNYTVGSITIARIWSIRAWQPNHKMLWWPGHRPTDILGVCSAPSRRVAALRPRFAGP